MRTHEEDQGPNDNRASALLEVPSVRASVDTAQTDDLSLPEVQKSTLERTKAQLGQAVWRYFQLRAINCVQKAIKRRDLPRLDGTQICVDCGAPATAYEHRDYGRPLDVEATCDGCNLQRGPAALSHAYVLRRLAAWDEASLTLALVDERLQALSGELARAREEGILDMVRIWGKP